MDIDTPEKVARIRELNDRARQTFTGCAVVMTAGLAHTCAEFRSEALKRVREFERFNKDNDPYGEHDFGAIQVGDVTINFKMDYYDLKMECGSEDPANPAVTQRVLTIGPSSDW
jgi:hypothetical protein